MNKSETDEHKRIKGKIQQALQQWLKGAGISEYPHSGQEADVFYVTYNGTTIIVEIIWSDGYTHFLEDLHIIQNSNATVKIVIVNPTILNNERFVHHYDKIRVAEFVKGYLISRLIDGSKILRDAKYLNKTVRDIILNLLEHTSPDPTQAAEHFTELKDKVVRPSLILLESHPEKIAFTKSTDIDIDLLNDLFKNHYPIIKPVWEKVVKGNQQKNKTDRTINEIIDNEVKKVLHRIGLNYKTSMYKSDVNAVPIAEVRDRLRKLIENRNFDLEIDNKLRVGNVGSRCEILFYNEYHPEIYSVEEGEKSKEKADEIRAALRQTFAEINSNRDIQNHIRRKNNLNNSEIHRKKLGLMLRQILSKTSLNIITQCSYMKPGLEC
jgi:hypothetical protein